MIEIRGSTPGQNGRVALVTGAARGIGLGIAARLICEGWQVVLSDLDRQRGGKVAKALGDRKGIRRYASLHLPMDEALAQVAIDFSGRPWIVWDAEFKREKIGEMPTEMFFHFFKSFSDTSLSNLNIKVEGDNEHHKIESIFKAFAKAIKMAVKRDLKALDFMPSTKGVL